jgi:hypothetical protein
MLSVGDGTVLKGRPLGPVSGEDCDHDEEVRIGKTKDCKRRDCS